MSSGYLSASPLHLPTYPSGRQFAFPTVLLYCGYTTRHGIFGAHRNNNNNIVLLRHTAGKACVIIRDAIMYAGRDDTHGRSNGTDRHNVYII